MTDGEKLRKLADWFDLYDKNHEIVNNEVQEDLRRMADRLDSMDKD